MKYRTIFLYKDYFKSFIQRQDKHVLNKIHEVLVFIESVKIIPKKHFKHITSKKGLYEIRIEVKGNAYRVFLFLMNQNLLFWEMHF